MASPAVFICYNDANLPRKKLKKCESGNLSSAVGCFLTIL